MGFYYYESRGARFKEVPNGGRGAPIKLPVAMSKKGPHWETFALLQKCITHSLFVLNLVYLSFTRVVFLTIAPCLHFVRLFCRIRPWSACVEYYPCIRGGLVGAPPRSAQRSPSPPGRSWCPVSPTTPASSRWPASGWPRARRPRGSHQKTNFCKKKNEIIRNNKII